MSTPTEPGKIMIAPSTDSILAEIARENMDWETALGEVIDNALDAELDRHELAEGLRKLAAVLEPEPTTWLRKTDAARLLGVSFYVVRNRCRRRTVRTRFEGGVELVHVEGLRRALAVRPYRPQPATCGGTAPLSL